MSLKIITVKEKDYDQTPKELLRDEIDKIKSKGEQAPKYVMIKNQDSSGKVKIYKKVKKNNKTAKIEKPSKDRYDSPTRQETGKW